MVDSLFPTFTVNKTMAGLRVPATLFLLVPLIVGLSFSIFSIFRLLKNNPFVVLLIEAQAGGELKDELLPRGTFGSSFPILLGIIWWSAWRVRELRLGKYQKVLIRSLLLLATLSLVLRAMLQLDRSLLMPVLVGTALLVLTNRSFNQSISRRFVVTFGALSVCALLMAFFSFSYFRGSISWNDQIANLMGYTAASYNRFAAVVHGSLHYPFAGRGIYLSNFLSFDETLGRFLPIRNLVFDNPDYFRVWASEFTAVSRAGLQPNFIWCGAFGYIFAEVGWFAPLVLFAYGLIYGAVWRSVKLGNTVGIVLYPWFAFNILYWIGYNYLLDTKLAFLFLTALGLILYERSLTQNDPIAI
jgi:hypothetical protein